MTKSVYDHYSSTELTSRDQLAVDRTLLAHERTLLSYARTMVGLIAVGGTLFQLSNHWLTTLASLLLLGTSIVVFAVGFSHFAKSSLPLYRLQHGYHLPDSKVQKIFALLHLERRETT